MFKQIKIFLLAMVLAVGMFSFSSSIVLAGNYGAGAAAKAAGLIDSVDNKVGASGVTDIIGNVVSSALTLVGVLFLILMLYGGIIWMLARGNDEYTRRALDTITAAIIGLIIVFASYAITQFVFDAVTGEAGGTVVTSATTGT